MLDQASATGMLLCGHQAFRDLSPAPADPSWHPRSTYPICSMCAMLMMGSPFPYRSLSLCTP